MVAFNQAIGLAFPTSFLFLDIYSHHLPLLSDLCSPAPTLLSHPSRVTAINFTVIIEMPEASKFFVGRKHFNILAN
jgi:hypothetical protein